MQLIKGDKVRIFGREGTFEVDEVREVDHTKDVAYQTLSAWAPGKVPTTTQEFQFVGDPHRRWHQAVLVTERVSR